MSLPHFKRKWRVLVANGDNVALDVSDLRVTFNINKSYQMPNYADITIYNLAPLTEQQIIQQGTRVIVEAGYEDGEYGKIFDGDIIQPIWDRRNVVDYTLELRCVDGDVINNNNFVAFTFAAQKDQRTLVYEMARQSRKSFEVDYVTDFLSSNKAVRGQTYFGQPSDYLHEIAIANDADFGTLDGKANIGRPTDDSPTEAVLINPQNGLVGTPEQTQDGVAFRCLLNPSIKFSYPAMLVKLDMKLIRQKKISIGQNLPSRLDADGQYKVISVTYIGDTRRNEWYCDVICCIWQLFSHRLMLSKNPKHQTRQFDLNQYSLQGMSLLPQLLPSLPP